MFAALDRLGLRARRNEEVPCCLALDESSMPAVPREFEWVGVETNQVDVAAGVQWLKDHVDLPGQDVLAITNQAFLRASFKEANIIINGSKTDLRVISAQAVKRLKLGPGQQPDEDDLMGLLKFIAGLYESKTTKRLRGEGFTYS